MTRNERHDSGVRLGEGLRPVVWLLILAGALALGSAIGFGIRHFFQTKGPVTLYDRALDFENE